MPVLPHGTRHRPRNRANMYGLAQHAERYERHARWLVGPLYRRVSADVIAAELPPGACVLDVGTGPGRVPTVIAGADPRLQVIGIDLSAEMIARAAAAAGARATASQLRFQVADVVALPFEDGSIDLVVSSISLHHWADPVAGLREVARVIRPGGQAWIYDVRPVLRRLHRGERLARTLAPDIEVRLESPMAGSFWFNPISRLVLDRS